MAGQVFPWLVLLCIGLCVGVFATDNFYSVMKQSGTGNEILVCYYTRSRRLAASSVPSDLCTHIIYAFGKLSLRGITPNSPSDVDTYRTLTNLKKLNPSLKVLLSLQHDFPSVVSQKTSTMKRISVQAVKFLQTYGFDGLDLDWEYPSIQQKDAFANFITILGSSLQQSNLLLSMALPNAPIWFRGYDSYTMNRYVDFMTVMAYDFHMYIKGKDNTTGYHSALVAPNGEMSTLSAKGMVDFYIQQYIFPNKLVLGIPTYGRSWTLADPQRSQLHSPAVTKGAPAPYSQLSGLYIYADVCVAAQRGAQKVEDIQNVAEYLHQGTSWVAFESIYTVQTKASWAVSRGLGGVGIWALQIDDAQNVCKMGSFPLIKAIRSIL